MCRRYFGLAGSVTSRIEVPLNSGCPVIGYPSKSVDGQVMPGGGEMVAQDHVEALNVALKQWLSDPQKLSQGRQGARRRVEDEFDIRRLSDNLWSEYQTLIK